MFASVLLRLPVPFFLLLSDCLIVMTASGAACRLLRRPPHIQTPSSGRARPGLHWLWLWLWLWHREVAFTAHAVKTTTPGSLRIRKARTTRSQDVRSNQVLILQLPLGRLGTTLRTSTSGRGPQISVRFVQICIRSDSSGPKTGATFPDCPVRTDDGPGKQRALLYAVLSM